MTVIAFFCAEGFGIVRGIKIIDIAVTNFREVVGPDVMLQGMVCDVGQDGVAEFAGEAGEGDDI